MKRIILTEQEQKEIDDEERKVFIEERKRMARDQAKEKAQHADEDFIDAGIRKFKGLFK